MKNKKIDPWKQFSDTIGGAFIPGKFFNDNKVIAKIRNWVFTLDIYRANSVVITRIVLPYANRDGFTFSIYNKRFTGHILKFFGVQYISSGNPAIDKNYFIRSNSEPKVRSVFSNSKICELIKAQPRIYLTIKGKSKLLGEDLFRLYFEEIGLIDDAARLKNIHELYKEIMYYLYSVGSAY